MEFIDTHRDRFGVEPICRVLREQGVGIAPSTYRAAKKRAPSARTTSDAALLVEIRRVHSDRNIGRGLYGARKVWNHLVNVEGRQVPRCAVERLMRANGIKGARRDKGFRTTKPDTGLGTRPPDLVQREFTASKPNELWVVDFTYVPTWSQMAFTAFVTDVYSRRIVGWRTASSMPTELPLDALEMALWTREDAGETVHGLIHHSDAGSQLRFNRWSQHRLALQSLGGGRVFRRGFSSRGSCGAVC